MYVCIYYLLYQGVYYGAIELNKKKNTILKLSELCPKYYIIFYPNCIQIFIIFYTSRVLMYH